MTFLIRFGAVFVVTLKRILAQRGLAVATSLGVIVSVALAMSIPIYADAVYQNILESEIEERTDQGIITSSRPPFAFMYRFVGAWSGSVDAEQLKSADTYLSGQVRVDMGLKERLFVRYFKTDNMRLYPVQEGSYTNVQIPLEWVYFSTVNNLGEHIQLLEGSMPVPSEGEPGSAVEVLMNVKLAEKLGLQVGEEYVTYNVYDSENGQVVFNTPVRIAGFWKPIDPKDDYWFYSPSEFEKALFVPEESFVSRILPPLNNKIYLGIWYWVMDGSSVQSEDVPGLLGRIALTRQRAFSYLPDMRLDISPEEILTNYQQAAQSLTLFLYAFSIPLILMILAFISLVVQMAIAQRQNEIAVMRSRGATMMQILGMAVLESLLLGAVGMAVGSPAAQGVAMLFGKARSFLDFSAQTTLNTQITMPAIRFGLAAAGVALIAQVLPTFSAARHTVITYKQERARQLRAPWWQRAWIDVLLMIPAGYGIYLLKYQGGLAVPGAETALSNDPFQNPLLLLVPALAIFALVLFILRLMPFVMGAFAWILSRTSSVGMMMAARYLSRVPGGYNAPMILLVLTLSLSTFTASIAQTLDRHMRDQAYYSVGADMSVVELGDFQGGSTLMPGGPPMGADSVQAGEQSEEQWVFLPVQEHLKIQGVQAAARVARTQVTLRPSAGTVGATFIGLDRVDFSQATFWRRDFSPQSLGALMNNLALTTEGVLVSRSFLERFNLKPGDSLLTSVYKLGNTREIEFKIVGVLDYFPTWYPEEGPLVVGNLDFLFEQVGGEFPYNVWMKIAPGSNYDRVLADVAEMYHRVMGASVSQRKIGLEAARPERQGFFGLLSVGFAALALLTVLGFLLYALFSFRRRFVELGMLRAIGLSAGQMMVFLTSELAFLFMVGLGAGTALGVWVSNMFIPSLQVGSGMSAKVPPFLVQIDWWAVSRIYILFGLLFVVALGVLGYSLLRMKIFQAVKLGEAV